VVTNRAARARSISAGWFRADIEPYQRSEPAGSLGIYLDAGFAHRERRLAPVLSAPLHPFVDAVGVLRLRVDAGRNPLESISGLRALHRQPTLLTRDAIAAALLDKAGRRSQTAAAGGHPWAEASR
jgi:hypothetical protein